MEQVPQGSYSTKFLAPSWSYVIPSTLPPLPIQSPTRQVRLNSIPVQFILPKQPTHTSPLSPPAPLKLDVSQMYKTSGLLTPKQVAIVESHASLILEKIKSGEWTSVEVTWAFIGSASIAHQTTNCLSSFFPQEALQYAQKLDDYFAISGGETVGPLHGLPLSFKDNFHLKGKDSNIGFIHLLNKPQPEDGAIAAILREAGCVFYAKTTLPTMMNNIDCISLVHGHTLNPYNLKIACGGSSGGEAALLACRGSPLGVGTDLAGSVRIPAAYCGLFGLRTSVGRLPSGCLASSPGQEYVSAVVGPMSRDLSSISLFCQAVIGFQPWTRDARCIPLPWNSNLILPTSGLKIGVIWDEGSVSITPPNKRAMLQVVELLKSMGHECVEWDHRDLFREARDHLAPLSADGGVNMRRIFEESGEPWPKRLAPNRTRKPEENITQSEFRHRQFSRRAWEKRYLDKWTNSNVDFLLSPVDFCTAPVHGNYKNSSACWLWSLLDYTCLTFPVTRSNLLDVRDELHKPTNPMDQVSWENYDPKEILGSPVSLQIVGPRLQEEKVIKMVEQIVARLDNVF